MTDYETPDTDLRSRAVARVKKKIEFRMHLFVYVMVNAALVVIWLFMGAGFFWPAFPLLGWGIGVIFHANDVYGRHEPSEQDVRREMERMR
jgi:hypothetical protein